MPHFCSVINCSMRAERDRVSFFRFPAALKSKGNYLNALSVERRNAWVQALKRASLSERQLKNGRVCSRHFITGKPAALEDKDNPDWLPNQNLGYTSTDTVQPSQSASTLCERPLKRVKIEQETEVEDVAAEELTELQQEETSVEETKENCSDSLSSKIP